MTEEFEINHPSDKRLTFLVIFHEEEAETGECGYSRGTPKIPARYEITGVVFNNGKEMVDITEFVIDHCEQLLPKWEEELLEQNPNGQE